MEVADDLADSLLDAEELVAEEVEHLERLILVEALHPRVVGLEDVLRADAHDRVVETRVRQLRDGRVIADHLEVLEKGAAPELRLLPGAIFFDDLFEGVPVVHWQRSYGSAVFSRPRRDYSTRCDAELLPDIPVDESRA